MLVVAGVFSAEVMKQLCYVCCLHYKMLSLSAPQYLVIQFCSLGIVGLFSFFSLESSIFYFFFFNNVT